MSELQVGGREGKEGGSDKPQETGRTFLVDIQEQKQLAMID